MSSSAVAERREAEFWEAEEQIDRSGSALRAVPVRPDDDRHARESSRPGDVAAWFAVLADQLEAESSMVSNTRRLMRHPAFIDLLALGDDVVPLLLDRLETSDAQSVWLRVLGSLKSFQPGAGQETIDASVAQWLQWGRREGYVKRLSPIG
jgi:hypothetical protein